MDHFQINLEERCSAVLIMTMYGNDQLRRNPNSLRSTFTFLVTITVHKFPTKNFRKTLPETNAMPHTSLGIRMTNIGFLEY